MDFVIVFACFALFFSFFFFNSKIVYLKHACCLNGCLRKCARIFRDNGIFKWSYGIGSWIFYRMLQQQFFFLHISTYVQHILFVLVIRVMSLLLFCILHHTVRLCTYIITIHYTFTIYAFRWELRFHVQAYIMGVMQCMQKWKKKKTW